MFAVVAGFCCPSFGVVYVVGEIREIFGDAAGAVKALSVFVALKFAGHVVGEQGGMRSDVGQALISGPGGAEDVVRECVEVLPGGVGGGDKPPPLIEFFIIIWGWWW